MSRRHLFISLLCLGWIVPGLIGHEPWTTDDAYTFAATVAARADVGLARRAASKSGHWLRSDVRTLARYARDIGANFDS